MASLPQATGPRPAALVFIFITVVLDTIAFGIIIPVLPKLVEQFAGGDTAHAAQVYGLFGVAWGLMHFFSAPIHGALSDRFGRRPLILLSCVGLGLDYVLMALAPSLVWLFVGRVLSGMTAASFTVCGAYIADVTQPEDRARAYGLYGAAWGLGFILGPAIGGLLGDGDPRLPFWVASGMAFVNTVYGAFVLPESLPIEKRVPFEWRKANPLGSLELLRSHRELFGLAGASALHYLAHTVMPSVFVLYAGYRYGWGVGTVGIALAVVGALSIGVQAGLIKPMVARFGERRTMVAGFLFGALGYALCGLAGTALWFWVALVVFEFIGLAPATLLSLMSQRVGVEEQGRLQGANTGLMGITGVIGPGLFAYAFAFGIHEERSWTLPGTPFFIAALLTVLAAWAAWRATRPELKKWAA
ncbi:MAG: TCR/Tet family MFS transporter [Panacagrimonas sp.]